jgi:tripartite ATP-independent transporter DctP family solute receptor
MMRPDQREDEEMNRRNLLQFCAAGAIAGLMTGSAAAQENLVLKSADVHPVGYPTVAAVESMGKKLSEATDGRLTIEIYPSMQLGGEKESLEQAQIGALAMSRVSVGVMGPIVPELNVFNLPYVFRSVDHMHSVIDGEIGDELLQKITDHPTAGLIGLAWMDAGTRSVYTDKPIARMEDLEGLKIRTMGNPMFVDMMNAMGGNGVSMGYDQLINALQTGVVDGAENNTPSYSTGQHYDYAAHYSLTEHLMIPEILVFSKQIWETLSAEDQELISKLAKEAQLEQRDLWMAKEAESLEDMKAHNVTITVVTPEEKARFQEAMAPVWERYGAEHTAMLDRIQTVQ